MRSFYGKEKRPLTSGVNLADRSALSLLRFRFCLDTACLKKFNVKQGG